MYIYRNNMILYLRNISNRLSHTHSLAFAGHLHQKCLTVPHSARSGYGYCSACSLSQAGVAIDWARRYSSRSLKLRARAIIESSAAGAKSASEKNDKFVYFVNSPQK